MDKKSSNSKVKRNFRGKGKNKSFPRTDERDTVKAEKANDPLWYTKVGQLTSDVATVSFNNPSGVPVTLNSDSEGANTLKFSAIPGIYSIYTVPSVGISPSVRSGSTAVNIAAQNLYSNIRYWNSGHSNYEPADLMIYLMSLDGIYSYYAYMARAYGVARIFSHTNRYVGDAMIRAMGIDPVNLRANLSDFRAYINSFVLKASTFAAPNTMSWFQRHVWMYSSIFSDEDVQKAQYYMYNPAVLWKFALNDDSSGMCTIQQVAALFEANTGSLQNRYNMSVQNLVDIGNTLLDAIYRDEDAGIISGDIIKAYGMDKLWKLAEIAPEYVTLPVFSEEVLMQIHNTRFAGITFKPDPAGAVSISCLNLTQDPSINKGVLIYEPKVKFNKMNTYDAILDTWHDNPTAEDVIVATRNMIYGIQNGDWIDIITCGSEICAYATVFYYNSASVLASSYVGNMDNWDNVTDALAAVTKFNEYPHYIRVDQLGNFIQLMGELSNYTILSGSEIMKMNESAILSELAVPHFGTASK